MKININTIYKKNFFIATLLFSGIFFLLFNISVENIQKGEILNYSYAVDCSCGGTALTVNGCQAMCSSTSTDTAAGSIGQPKIDGGITVEGGGIFFGGMQKILLVILKLVGFLIGITVSLISLSIDPVYSNMLFDSTAVYSGWKIVRDFLNVFFVFFLLFSAFATVFQVQSYHIKKTWVLIVVMALLVNFSWPVTRVIVDFTNVIMAQIIGDSGGENIPGSGMLADFGDSSKFIHLMIGDAFWGEDGWLKDKTNIIDGSKDGVMMALLFGIGIGLFILFTFLTVSFILMARTMILVILLIFAPIGYVLLAFPATKSYASGWWNLLFKQAFIGPIIVFLLFLATKILEDTTDDATDEFAGILTTQVGSNSFEAVASVLLAMGLFWTAILAAQKMSGQTAGLALSAARKARGMAVNGMKKGIVGGAKMVGRRADSATGGRVGGGLARLNNFVNPLSKDNKEAFDKQLQTKRNARKKGNDPTNALEAQKKVDKMKEYKEAGTETSDIANELKNLKGGELSGAAETIINSDNLSSPDMSKLIASMDNLSETQQEAVLKKAAETGKGSMAINKNADIIQSKNPGMSNSDARKESITQTINRTNGKTIGKDADLLEMGANGTSADQSVIKTAMRDKYHSVKGRQKITSEMSGRQNSNNFIKITKL